jgi:hypothetical protein
MKKPIDVNIPRIGRTYPCPPPEMEGLEQNQGRRLNRQV